MAARETAMRLAYLPPNQAYAFVMGDSVIRLEEEDMFFPSRKDASEAARRHDLLIDARGVVQPIPDFSGGDDNPVEQLHYRVVENMRDAREIGERASGELRRRLEVAEEHLRQAWLTLESVLHREYRERHPR